MKVDREPRKVGDVAMYFHVLSTWWHADTDAKSVDREKFEHPAYKRVLALGLPAIPFILADLRDQHGHWFSALRELAADDSVDADAKGSMKRARDAWLKWGESNKLI